MRVLTRDKIRINQRLWAFGMPWSLGFVLGLPPRGGFWKQSTWPWNMIHLMPRIHVDFTSILHSHTMLVPQAWCEANMDWLRLFHQWECLKCNGHGLSARVWSGPKLFQNIHQTASCLLSFDNWRSCLKTSKKAQWQFEAQQNNTSVYKTLSTYHLLQKLLGDIYQCILLLVVTKKLVEICNCLKTIDGHSMKDVIVLTIHMFR
jgi:hypothetical protein